MSIIDDAAKAVILARYRERSVPDLAYATVEDFCDSADSLPQICRFDGDLKDAQRPWMVKAILGRVPLGSRLLEIGGGYPLAAAALHDLGYAVTLIDPYEGAGDGPTAYQEFVRSFPEVRIVRAEFGNHTGELVGESFDCIYSISVLEHLAHSRLADFFLGIGRFLRPGGQSLHCMDHVTEGGGADWHETGLKEVLLAQDRLRASGADPSRRSDVEGVLRELLERMTRDLGTFYLSPQGHHQWRGGKPYHEFPFRKVVSIQTCATKS